MVPKASEAEKKEADEDQTDDAEMDMYESEEEHF